MIKYVNMLARMKGEDSHICVYSLSDSIYMAYTTHFAGKAESIIRIGVVKNKSSNKREETARVGEAVRFLASRPLGLKAEVECGE